MKAKAIYSRLLAARTFSHFAVDLGCSFLAASCFVPAASAPGAAAAGILLYNLTAFALQPFLGAVCDRFPRLRGAFWGCFAVFAALLWALSAKALSLPLPAQWPALVLCALGNALFHAGAGRDVLLGSEGKLKPGGIFVSSGALGVPLGALLSGLSGPVWTIPAACLALSLPLLARWEITRRSLTGPCRFRAASSLPFWAVILLSLLSVAVRSFVGSVVPMVWKTGWLALAAGGASCLGKAAGGFFADRLGARRTGVLALLFSLPLLCLGNGNLWLSLLGLFCFNCTMPVSLGTVAAKLPDSPGLAFGLTAQFMIVGCLPLYFAAVPAAAVLPLCAGLTVFSALCIALSSSNFISGSAD